MIYHCWHILFSEVPFIATWTYLGGDYAEYSVGYIIGCQDRKGA